MIPQDKLKALSTDTLRALNTAIVTELKSRRYVESVKKAGELSVGDKVGYDSRRTGWTIGRIERVNRTRAHVRTIGGDGKLWIVPMSMLQAQA